MVSSNPTLDRVFTPLGDLRIDFDAGCVLRGDREVHLQPLSWRLLSVMMSGAPGRLFTDDELRRALWPEVHVTRSSLSQAVRRLRTAIGEELLVTVPRRGYRLAGPRPAAAPGSPDRIVGRRAELGELETAIAEGARLITIVGPAGVGKTRLATELAARSPRPSAVVDLAAPEVASHPTLLVLDGVDHAVDAAREGVSRWLSGAPERIAVVTSREVLGVRGERLLTLDPLDRPDAIALLRDRAGVDLRDTDVEQLVVATDGLPLAIELVAPRLRVMPAAVVAQRVLDLTNLVPGAPDRHRSLGSAFAESWAVLGPSDRRALVALAAIEGPFGWDRVDSLPDDVVQTLVDRSWVRVDRRRGQLSIWPTIRAFVSRMGGG